MSRSLKKLFATSFVFVLLLFSSFLEIFAQEIDWIDQFGTEVIDKVIQVKIDNGGYSYVIGITTGSFLD